MSKIFQTHFSFQTQARQTLNITEKIQQTIDLQQSKAGLCHLFIRHTSASLLICENADPQVRRDLETFLVRLVPDGSPFFLHQTEGPDDMPAHIRTILMQSDLTIPVVHGKLALGTWQGIYLYEHRTHSFTREVMMTLIY